MRKLLDRIEEGKKISMISSDSDGNFSFMIDGEIYDGKADSGVVSRAEYMSRKSPGKALNMLKKFSKLVKR